MRPADFFRRGKFCVAIKKRSVELALTLAAALSIIVAGTFAWFSLIQNTTNDFEYTPADLRLVKYETGTELPLAGAIFDLFDADHVHIGRYVTDENGEITATGLDGDKQYYFREVKAPAGYRKPEEDRTDTVGTGGEPLTVYNARILAALSIVKTIGETDLKGEPYLLTEEDKEFPFAFLVTIGTDGAAEYDYEIRGADGALPASYDYAYAAGPQKGETIHVNAEGKLKSGDTLYLRHGETAVIDGVPALTRYQVAERDYMETELDPDALAGDDFGCADETHRHSKEIGAASGWAGYGNNTVGNLGEEGSVVTFENRRVPEEYKITMASLAVVDRILGHPDDIDLEKEFSVTITVGEDPEQTYWYEVIHPESVAAVLPEYAYEYEYYQRNDPGLPDPLTAQTFFGRAADRGYAPPEGPGSYAGKEPLHRPTEYERWKQVDGGLQTLTRSSGNEITAAMHHGSAVIVYGVPTGTRYTVTQAPDQPDDGYRIDSTVKTEGVVLPDLDVLPDPDTDDPLLLRVRADIFNYFVRPVMKTVTVTKKWDHTGNPAPPPTSTVIDVIDVKTGLVYDSRTLTRLEDWIAAVTVPKYDPDTGEEIDYGVAEHLPPDYVLGGMEETGDGFTLTNLYAPAAVRPGVKKVAEGDPLPQNSVFTFEIQALTDGAPMPDGGNTVSIPGEGTAFFGAIRFTGPGTYNYRIWEQSGGLTGCRFDPSAYILTAEVTRDERGKLAVAAAYNKDGRPEHSPLLFQNSYTRPGGGGGDGGSRPTAGLTVTKRVTGGGADHERKFDFTLRVGGMVYRVALADGESYTLTDIPVGTRYTVTETETKGYITATSGSGGVIEKGGSTADFLNAGGCPPNVERGSLTVKKTVTGPYVDTTKPFRFTVRLGRAEYEFTLRHGESRTFEGIPAGTPYEVVEEDCSAEGYLSIGTDAAGTITAGRAVAAFENRYDGPEPPPPDDDTVRLSGRKSWDHGDNPEAAWPRSITVYVMNGSAIAAQKTVTAAEDWRYAFQLPKYDPLGNPIVYSVSEAAVERYTASVHGYDLTNTYTGAPPGEGPKTGDDSHLWAWVLLLAAASAALVWIVIPGRPEGKRMLRRRSWWSNLFKHGGKG